MIYWETKRAALALKVLTIVELNLSSVLENQPWLRKSPTV